MLPEDKLYDLSDEELEALVREERTAGSNEEPQGNQNEEESDPDLSNDNLDDEESQNDEVEAEDESASEVEEEEQASTENETQDVGSNESTEEQTEESKTDTPNEIELPALKASGKEIPINDLSELYTLAAAGFDYTKKTQEIAPFRKAVAMMKENGLSEEDLSLLLEAKKGNKDAVAMLIKQAGIDPMEVDEPNSDYRPGAFIPDETALNLKEVQQEIMRDPEYQITADVVNNQMDPVSQEMMAKNPMLIKGIHEDIKTGAYNEVLPYAEKLRVMDGGRKPLMEYYIEAAQQVFPPQQQAPVVNNVGMEPNVGSQQVQQAPQRKVNTAAKKAAGSTRAKIPPKRVIDVDEMSDEELMKMREEILSRY